MCSDVAVQVRGLGKRYAISATRAANGSTWQQLRTFFGVEGGSADEFWALRDIDFEVRRGEILGILGKNGSGKSTLLKILSRITSPTEGEVRIRGRVGSLLEVGTGFHPDLTGRENIFMSGALLGMSQREIKAKFDEIVEFSGVERFIDTPVKRYSSGMYVRLAYAVAAHLNAEIMILDEVLAVGDAEFRKKSLKNMERLSTEGRTILFVSHNSTAVRSLCTRAIVLEAGRKAFDGNAAAGVTTYLNRLYLTGDRTNAVGQSPGPIDLKGHPRFEETDSLIIESVEIRRHGGSSARDFETGDALEFVIGYRDLHIASPYFAVLITNNSGDRVATISSTHASPLTQLPESGVIRCVVPDIRLGSGDYTVMLDVGHYGGSRDQMHSIDCVPNATTFGVSIAGYLGGIGLDEFQGAAHRSQWAVLPLDEQLGQNALGKRK